VEKWLGVVILAVVIILIIAEIRHRGHREKQARVDFRLSVSGTEGENYAPLHQARRHTLTWICSQPNTYALCANGDVWAVLYLTEYGDLVGANSAGGPWAVEGDRRFSGDFSLRQVQSQIEVVRLRESHRTIEFPQGRAFPYERTGFFRVKWVLRDDSSQPLIITEQNSRIVRIDNRAYSMPELPFLVLLGGYLMINDGYGDDA
jgi:hypothetical protein